MKPPRCVRCLLHMTGFVLAGWLGLVVILVACGMSATALYSYGWEFCGYFLAACAAFSLAAVLVWAALAFVRRAFRLALPSALPAPPLRPEPAARLVHGGGY